MGRRTTTLRTNDDLRIMKIRRMYFSVNMIYNYQDVHSSLELSHRNRVAMGLLRPTKLHLPGMKRKIIPSTFYTNQCNH